MGPGPDIMSTSLPMKKACLLTGGPGTGKTTVIKEVLRKGGWSAGGFYTEEIRDGGTRSGFRIVTLDGDDAVLSHVGMTSSHRVGKYGVDVGSLDAVAIPAVREAIRNREIVVIDEIGKMELLSPGFRGAVDEALGSGKRVLGTVMLASHPWVDSVKQRFDVGIVFVSRSNHAEVVGQLLDWLRS